MRVIHVLAVVSFATTCLIGALPAEAGKPSGGGSAIKVQELIKPAGSVEAYASDVNDSGTVAIGAAYWDATWDYRNNFYGVRWTRPSTSDPWVAEDLRLRFPPDIDTRGLWVNDAGTAVFMSYNSAHHYVMTNAGGVIDLGSRTVADLSNNDTMVGSVWTSQSVALFWASPSSTPTELPPLASGFGAAALMFQGANVIGWADDSSGRWAVRWTNGAGEWSAHRIVLLPPKAGVGGMNSAGRLSLSLYEPSGGQYSWDYRPAVWDPPYTQPPVYLPTLSGTAGGVGAVLEDGTVVGTVTASSKTVKNWLPVIWPTPASLVPLPLPSGAKYGEPHGANAYRQVAGVVSFVDKWGTNEHAVIWTVP